MKTQTQTRIIHAEHDHIPCGKLGIGSPNWSRAITWFKRPNDVAIPKKATRKITNIKALESFANRPAAKEQHNPSSVIIPNETKVESSMPTIDKVFAVQKSYWERLGMPMVQPEQPKAAKEKLVAVMEYGHKTAGHSVVMTKEQAQEFKRRVRRKGYGTCLRFSPKV